MKIIQATLAAALAVSAFGMAGAAQAQYHDDRDHHDSDRDHHDGWNDRDRHDGDRHDWGRRGHRHCWMVWRHHHRERVCGWR